jgi:tRNA-modifying protein YgfZ
MSTAPAASGRLSHLGILRFTGPDALNFLQGQLSNDTRLLSDNAVQMSAYSSPQGRVFALIYLIAHSSGVLAILPREILKPTQERLRKFVLRAKVQIADAGDLILSGYQGDAALLAAGFVAPEMDKGYHEHEAIGIARIGTERRYFVVSPAVPEPDAKAAQAQEIENAWRLADIRAGRPQVFAATSEAFVAQMLNLDLLGAISFGKGCYTGQEIIARTQHLGRIKRRLFRLSLPPGAWSVGQALQLSDGRAGKLTDVIDGDAGIEALAVLSVEPGSDSEAAGSAVAAAQLPLPYPSSPAS